MALDSVTSSGREPSMSLMDGSAPAFSRSSTMSANSQADAMKRKEKNDEEVSGKRTKSTHLCTLPERLMLFIHASSCAAVWVATSFCCSLHRFGPD